MKKFVSVLTLAAMMSGANVAYGQVGGNLAQFPPVDLEIMIHETEAGTPELSTTEVKLITGEYYRLNVLSDGETDWRFEAPDLLANSHLRVLTVNDGIEVHLQSLVFRAFEFDEPGKVSFGFVPIRPGTYQFTVGRNPIAQGLAAGTSGVQEPEFRAEGSFVVE
ncbi:hypothetical protein [Devosia faecipullorum]|uniref:hypothetical protein n=1 Tax=Devosia faecipullorum TaxID=2755039 RepID=UPI00187B9232|nr:hypothetical protein [Devosia faecipullorum]MBE7731926.1 hypothetical protein [Devosia faecipullorum]